MGGCNCNGRGVESWEVNGYLDLGYRFQIDIFLRENEDVFHVISDS